MFLLLLFVVVSAVVLLVINVVFAALVAVVPQIMAGDMQKISLPRPGDRVTEKSIPNKFFN